MLNFCISRFGKILQNIASNFHKIDVMVLVMDVALDLLHVALCTKAIP